MTEASTLPSFSWSTLATAGPLTLALLCLLALLVLLIRKPSLLDRIWPARKLSIDEARGEMLSKVWLERFERHAKKVHDMDATFGEARGLVLRVTALEAAMQKQQVETATLVGSVQAAREKLDDLCERVDRNDEVMGGRIDGLASSVRDLTNALLRGRNT